MSLQLPIKAIPINVYSIKATFLTERAPDGSSIADKYTLKIRKVGETAWTSYQFGSVTLYCYIDNLTPYTQYETQWQLTKTNATTFSEIHNFYTRYSERFPLRPAIPTPMYGEDFPNALQAELDSHIDYINTLEDEKAIERFLKEGVGKITGSGLLLSSPQNLSITNGWFQSGSGLPRDDPKWFPGARIFQIASGTGAKEIIIPDSPVLNTDGILYGYAAAYEDEDGAPIIDIEWIPVAEGTAPEAPTNGRWIVGKITVAGGLITSVDDSMATQIPTLLSLQQAIASLSLGGGTGGGGGGTGGTGGGGGPSDADKLKYNPTDISVPPESTYAAVNRKTKELRDYIDGKLKSLQPGQETSLEFFISQFARSLPGWGTNNPAGLLRIDAAVILPEQYGQAGITLDLDGIDVPSPQFEGAGNLTYSSTLKLWEV